MTPMVHKEKLADDHENQLNYSLRSWIKKFQKHSEKSSKTTFHRSDIDENWPRRSSNLKSCSRLRRPETKNSKSSMRN